MTAENTPIFNVQMCIRLVGNRHGGSDRRKLTRKWESILLTSIRFAVLYVAVLQVLPAQSVQSNRKPQYYPVHSVISPVRQIVGALGDRVQKVGRERLIFTGTLNRKGVVSALQVIRQTPGLLRVDEQGGRGKSLVFDLESLKGSAAIDEEDETLAESIENDSAEAFLAMLRQGTSVRHLGDRFKVKGETGFGAEVDIFDVVVSVGLKRDKRPVTKRFMFDSRSGLLRRVHYSAQLGGRTVAIQTVLSDYSLSGGYMLPGKIARFVDGSEVFAFTRISAVLQPASGSDSTFITPGK